MGGNFRSKTSKVHHCPKKFKGNCRPAGIICREHETLCVNCEKTHLKTQPCPRCDHYTINDKTRHCEDPIECGVPKY